MGPPHVFIRSLLHAVLLACIAIAALPADASATRSTAEHVSIPAGDAQYQRLIDATNAVVAVKVKALPNARSNETLGALRQGSGVLIGNDGLVLTIGYLITEADQVEVTDSDGTTIPATVVDAGSARISILARLARSGNGLDAALGQRLAEQILDLAVD